MMRRLCVLLACALGPVALLAGCGGSSTSTGPTSGLSVQQAKQRNKADTAKAVAHCEQAANNPGLPASQKPLMETECQDIRTGNNTGLHAIDKQLCQVQAAAKPQPERTTLLAQCKQL
jgi:uncharacterized protein YceK